MEKEIEEIVTVEEEIDKNDTENKKYDESRIYYVYEHIRLDKMEPFYIGKGKGERAYDLYRNDHHDAITDEYGHAVVIIADHLTEEEAYWLERDTIEDYVFNLGYGIDIKGHSDYNHELPHLTNMDWGGIGGKSGVQHSEETKRKMSEAKSKMSEETKIKMSEAHKGEKNPMFGKNAFANKTTEEMEEIRRKMGEKSKGKNPYANKTAEEMEIIANKKSNSMKGKMVGEKNPMFGKNPFANKTTEEMEEISKKKIEKLSKKVMCITTGETFDCIKDAEKNYSCSHISECCKGKRNYAGKLNGVRLQWKFLENDDNESKAV